jgi:hypothetical protein
VVISEIRPKSGGLLERVPPGFMFLISTAAVLGIAVAFRSGHYLSPAIILPLLAALYAMAYLSLRKRNLRLYLRGEVLGKVTGLGRHLEVQLASVAELRLVSVTVPNVAPLRLLLVLDKDHRRLLTIGRAYQFDLAELRDFAAAAGVPLVGSLEEEIASDAYSV